ncbi:MAG: phosphatidylcholine synthase [Gemmatales bacterium]|nr:MAG: phosphatidylcholine synthase [Gemmatales bacterium]
MFFRQLCAWGVHLYTGLGLVASAGMAVAIVNSSFRTVFVWMVFATLIDATDGALARLARVKEVLPGFDGRRLDDIIDYLNFTFLPILLVWRAELLPTGWEYWLVAPLLASAYGFCQVQAKTDDGYFLGFPSYWNIVAFYLYFLQLPGPAVLGLMLTLAFLTFVPSRYLYPSQKGTLNLVTNILAAGWTVLLLLIIFDIRTPLSQRSLLILSLYFPVYYMATSWFITMRIWLRRTPAQ